MGLRVARGDESQPNDDQLARELLAVNSAKQEKEVIVSETESQKKILNELQNSSIVLKRDIDNFKSAKLEAELKFKEEKEKGSKELANLSLDISSAKSQLTAVLKEIDSYREKMAQDITSYKPVIDDLKNKVRMLEDEKSSLEQSIELSRLELNKVLLKIESLESDINSKNEALSSLGYKTNEMTVFIESKSKNILSLDSEIQSRKDKISTLNDEIKDLQNSKSDALTEIEIVKNNFAEEQKKLDALVGNISSIIKKQERIDRLTIKIQELYRKAGIDISNELN